MATLKTPIICAIWLIWLAWPLGGPAEVLADACDRTGGRAIKHPSDGPDVDLRLRLEADELVVTAIVNLAFCDEFLDLAREDEEAVAKEEEPSMFEALGEVIGEKMKVAIDGISVDPLKREFESLPIEYSVAPQFPKFGLRAITRLRARYTYSLTSAPRSIGFAWNLYPANLAIGERDVVPLLEIKSEWLMYGESILVDLKATEPEHTWHGEGKAPANRLVKSTDALVPVGVTNAFEVSPWMLPLLLVGMVLGLGMCFVTKMRRMSVAMASLFCVGTGAFLMWQATEAAANSSGAKVLNEDAALEIFKPLHSNIYRAFDFSREEEVYDALARSIAGEHLDEIYNQVYRGLVMQDQGGAVSRIQNVDPLETTVDLVADKPEEFAVETTWRVKGRVFHWGHTHWRTNEYRARYTVTQVDDAWKITASKVLGQRRIKMEGDDPEGEGG